MHHPLGTILKHHYLPIILLPTNNLLHWNLQASVPYHSTNIWERCNLSSYHMSIIYSDSLQHHHRPSLSLYRSAAKVSRPGRQYPCQSPYDSEAHRGERSVAVAM